MSWLSKIFTRKVYEDVKLDGKFKDAVETTPLVISGGVLTKPYNVTVELEKSLTKLTKNQLVEHAQSEHGMELDRRLTKQKMIDRILEE
tara:strand:- start:448 stop:714 length:267 start_codon:yes stop_codon:yes gene_type:complete